MWNDKTVDAASVIGDLCRMSNLCAFIPSPFELVSSSSVCTRIRKAHLLESAQNKSWSFSLLLNCRINAHANETEIPVKSTNHGFKNGRVGEANAAFTIRSNS